MSDTQSKLSEKYKKEIAQVLGEISDGVSEKVRVDVDKTVKELISRIDFEKDKYEGVGTSIRNFEDTIEKNGTRVEELSQKVEFLSSIISKFKEDTSKDNNNTVTHVNDNLKKLESATKTNQENLREVNVSIENIKPKFKYSIFALIILTSLILAIQLVSIFVD